ncbi:Uroporphyrin-III C/tetrapyrrole (Corrin/Porphyrin) methyltransferase (modular protein) [Parafrankia sp. Ea1.12]|uniref:SAM-dependent methyltransferase n=1 Tax=Parafrankia sp. Ea1.12 TaxID=573499 RepID=UPI000DA44156|nr:SAM-dependent methyltransferase [Parafrankia sp. Ea1.12]SQD97356.1 Uroporphyrin-III C/tetrapyrrole (Corrin/Porphyrin) methyltransferase (modular protein) [Parafrankia sp. Ea1.12]
MGTGCRVGDITLEARACLEQADKVFHVIADPLTAKTIRDLNPSTEDLHALYEQGKDRKKTYAEMVARILSEVRLGNFACAAYYGHPGVFAFPTHESIRQARAEGYSARMLPAVSAEDWLFADFGVDPSTSGCQSFETTDFLVNRRRHDPTSHLILWQVGVIGALDFRWRYDYRKNLGVLTEQLLRHYNSDHRVALYRINPIPICDPDIEWMRLTDLPTASLTASSTLLVPPLLTRDDAGETSAPGGGGVPELAHRLPVGAVQQLGARVGPPLRRDSEDIAATQRAPCSRSRTHST